MPDELKSFLVSVSVILAVALFVPCIEKLVNLLRHNNRSIADEAASIPAKPVKRFRREAA